MGAHNSSAVAAVVAPLGSVPQRGTPSPRTPRQAGEASPSWRSLAKLEKLRNWLDELTEHPKLIAGRLSHVEERERPEVDQEEGKIVLFSCRAASSMSPTSQTA
jgi:hypothetical protein